MGELILLLLWFLTSKITQTNHKGLMRSIHLQQTKIL